MTTKVGQPTFPKVIIPFHSVSGGGKKKQIFASLIINKIWFAETYDSYQASKTKIRSKASFSSILWLFEVRKCTAHLDENGVLATNFLEIYVSKHHLNCLFTGWGCKFYFLRAKMFKI